MRRASRAIGRIVGAYTLNTPDFDAKWRGDEARANRRFLSYRPDCRRHLHWSAIIMASTHIILIFRWVYQYILPFLYEAFTLALLFKYELPSSRPTLENDSQESTFQLFRRWWLWSRYRAVSSRRHRALFICLPLMSLLKILRGFHCWAYVFDTISSSGRCHTSLEAEHFTWHSKYNLHVNINYDFYITKHLIGLRKEILHAFIAYATSSIAADYFWSAFIGTKYRPGRVECQLGIW